MEASEPRKQDVDLAVILESLPVTGLEVMICLLPPSEHWEQWVRLKEPFFKKGLRKKGREPFPHITLSQTRINARSEPTALFGVIDAIKEDVENKKESEFMLQFSLVQNFDVGKNGVVYVTSEEESTHERALSLHKIAESATEPLCNGKAAKSDDFTLHIGLGSVPKSKLTQIMEEYKGIVANLESTSFTCQHIYLLVRGPTGPWKVASAIPLEGCNLSVPSIPVGTSTCLAAVVGGTDASLAG
uniref:Uncharacterized protein n=1 Tax=Trieres chinensis TaxID=1514140 RepID=A0A7S1ZHG1_TRICV